MSSINQFAPESLVTSQGKRRYILGDPVEVSRAGEKARRKFSSPGSPRMEKIKPGVPLGQGHFCK